MDGANLGFLCVHQYTTIGSGTMIGMQSALWPIFHLCHVYFPHAERLY